MAALRSASVVVSTRNRAASVVATLEHLEKQQVPDDLDWEVLVVDNGSTDATAELVEAAIARMQVPLRLIREERIGLSNARNRGWREAQGEVVAFLDDDTRPVAEWLVSMLTPFEDPQVAGVTGRLLPILEREALGENAVDWANEFTFDFGGELRETPRFSGANMSILRSWLERVGGFDTRLGRVGGCLLASEEHDLHRRLKRSAERPAILYNPAALVHHQVDHRRLEDAVLLKRYYCVGISGAWIDAKEGVARQAFELAYRQVKQGVWLARVLRTLLSGRKPSLQQRARAREFLGYYRETFGGQPRACAGCPQAAFRLRLHEGAAVRRGGVP